MSERPVVIVGAGLAGLACALELQRQGVAVRVLEAAERPGGCLWTDEVDGFRIDRGFQVFLEGYPEARARIDYGALALQGFAPGARVFSRGRLRTVADPLRQPLDSLRTLASGIATPADALRVLRLLARLRASSLEQILTAPQESTRERLHALGFSARLIDEFMRPFFAGVFLDAALATSSRAFDFTFRTFAAGGISLPARGIQAIPEQLAARLPPGSLQCSAPVARLTENGAVVLERGDELAARALVVATHEPEAVRLLGGAPARASRSATTLWWAARTPPVRGPFLLLDGEGTGPVNHLCVASEVAPALAPAGRALISGTVIGDCAEPGAAIDARSRLQLRAWFGAQVEEWRLLRVQQIRDTLPAQAPAVFEPVTRPVAVGAGRFVCGGHREIASIGGALRSGRRAANAVLASFAR